MELEQFIYIFLAVYKIALGFKRIFKPDPRSRNPYLCFHLYLSEKSTDDFKKHIQLFGQYQIKELFLRKAH